MSLTNQLNLVPYLPDNAPFSAQQRAYLNGLLAGVFSGASATSLLPEEAASATRPLTILFGSQTGNAEMLAKQTAKRAKAEGFAPEVFDMADYPQERLASEANLFIITSTYGDGEPPDNAAELHAWLHSDQVPPLEHVRFSVLGLGDSNYPDFNQCAREFDQRLAELGARRMRDSVYCDVEFDEDFEAWLRGCLAAAGGEGASPDNGKTPVSAGTPVNAVAASDTKARSPDYNRKHPYPAKLLRNNNLNGEGSAKETRHVEMDLGGSGLKYEAGDALGVFPVNCAALVDEFLARSGFDGEEAVPGMEGTEVPLRMALAEHYDITNLTKQFLAAYAPFANHPALNGMLAEGEGLDEYLEGRQIIDPLGDFPAQWATAAEFVGMFKNLAPRLYSISSSPKAYPGQVHLTVGTVRYEMHGRARKGVCSTFLADLAEGSTVQVYVQPNKHFKPPTDQERPMIMVGPGTGIAPFRAFLEERVATGSTGKHWLFFGDQKRATDFLYEAELCAMRDAGNLHRLDLAFSRDGTEKVYVQHRMLEQAIELFAWLEEGAHFYVCGDASRMAKDVDAALHQVIQRAGGKSEVEAALYVDDLRKQKRYVRDVY